ADLDTVEIEVRYEEEAFRLVAAIELVSPANKDRPSARRTFAATCAAYLQRDVAVVVVDIVTDRQESLHDDLMSLIGLDDEPAVEVASSLYAVAYRAVAGDGLPRLEMWPELLQLGSPLPVLPLWIAPKQAVPLDLEASYTEAC